MKKKLPKIITFLIIFVLGLVLGIFIGKKTLENRSDLQQDFATKIVENMKSVETSNNIEEKKNALNNAYSEMEKINKQEIKIQEEIMKLENDINNEMNLKYLEQKNAIIDENDTDDTEDTEIDNVENNNPVEEN